MRAEWGKEETFAMTPVRSSSAFDFIRLPKMDAISAHSLGMSILAAAEGQTLTEAAQEAHDDVKVALLALGMVLKGKLPKEHSEEGLGTRQADWALDRAWSATYDFLNGWAKLDDEPKAAIAAEMRERLYPDGLKFTKIKYSKQWTESHRRLDLIAEGRLAAHFTTLGGEAFLDTLKRAHEAYGEVLGITKAPEEPVEEQKIRDALDGLSHALRAYVLHVSAIVRRDDPAQKALVEKLLAPLAQWQSPAVAKATVAPVVTEEAAETPAEAPVEPPAEGGGCG